MSTNIRTAAEIIESELLITNIVVSYNISNNNKIKLIVEADTFIPPFADFETIINKLNYIKDKIFSNINFD